MTGLRDRLVAAGRMEFPADKKTVRDGDVFTGAAASGDPAIKLPAESPVRRPYRHRRHPAPGRLDAARARAARLTGVDVHAIWTLASRTRPDLELDIAYVEGDPAEPPAPSAQPNRTTPTRRSSPTRPSASSTPCTTRGRMPIRDSGLPRRSEAGAATHSRHPPQAGPPGPLRRPRPCAELRFHHFIAAHWLSSLTGSPGLSRTPMTSRRRCRSWSCPRPLMSIRSARPPAPLRAVAGTPLRAARAGVPPTG
ncbi:hypothetical protein ACU686_33055 [Yinghuangia aomiensis]